MAGGNFLDRAIGWVAPEAGARRMRARAVTEVLGQRLYGGAAGGRLGGNWQKVNGASADNEIAAAGALLRNRMRALVRNNPHAANAVAQLVSHVIGDGIMPRANTGDAAKNKKINDLFDEWSKICDADGQLDFYGLQSLIFRGMVESGDGLVRRRRRVLADKLPVPLKLQVLETDLIDSAKVGPQGANGTGNVAVQGIEFNGIGQRTAYWMFQNHPGDAWLIAKTGNASKPIPAIDIAHVYEKLRTQVRGAPWGTPVLRALDDLGSYEEAEIVRKRIEACMVGILVRKGEDDGVGLPTRPDDPAREPGVYDSNGVQVERFEPGMFAFADGVDDIKFNTPAATGNYEAYKRASLHTIAAGFRMPYIILAGDFSAVTYSSSKVGLEPFRRLISATQWQVVIPMICEPIWQWFCEAAYFAGKIDSAVIPVEWSPPKFYSADPAKDANATIAEVRAGLRSAPEAIAATGRNPEVVLEEIATWNAKLDAKGVILDTDPRKVSRQGMFQIAAEPDEPPPAPPKGIGT